jgi:hypothetical protein
MEQPKLVILAEKSNRLHYVCDFIFSYAWGIEYLILTPHSTSIPENRPIINYSNQSRSGTFIMNPSGILTDGVTLTPPSYLGSGLHFKPYPDERSETGFDLFAAVFYLLSRAEEYGEHKVDNHGRYLPSNSILYRAGILHKPIIDYWLSDFYYLLQNHFPVLRMNRVLYHFIPTIDVDNAYAFNHKGLPRTIGATMKDLIKLDFPRLRRRWQVMQGREQDPYDTYEYIQQLDEEQGVRTTFFWLVGAYGPFDTNLPPHKSAFRDLIRRLSQEELVGLHPSYRSNESFKQLRQEHRKLEEIVGHAIVRSRQHYLKLSLPDSYSKLAALGILEDYSMGYASQPGFRAGTCHPFYFYDLTKERASRLKIYPVAIMEVTLRQYLGLEIQEAIAYYTEMIREIKKNQGVFVSLWHNESLSDEGRWSGWREVYESMFREATKIH